MFVRGDFYVHKSAGVNPMPDEHTPKDFLRGVKIDEMRAENAHCLSAQPAGSRVLMNDRPEGLTLDVPAPGFFGTSINGMLFVGCLLYAAIMAGVMVVLSEAPKQNPNPDSVLAFLLVLMWSPLVGLLVAWINLARRSVVIAIAGGRLLIIHTGLFGQKKKEWDVEEIAEVRAAKGRQVMGIVILQLQVLTYAGKKTDFLTGYGGTVLCWMAEAITLRLRQTQAARPASSPSKPVGSEVSETQRREGLVLDVPATGLRHGSLRLFLSAAFGLVCVGVFAILYNQNEIPQIQRLPRGPWWWWLLGLCALGAIGVLIQSINMACRKATITIADGRLLIVETNLLGQTKREWAVADIVDVKASQYEKDFNENEIFRLEIHPREGEVAGFLGGRDGAELKWFADTIKARLRG